MFNNILWEITVKIRLKRINTQKEVTVEMLLDSGVIGLVISSKFVRKQEFKLKKIKKTNIYKKYGWFFNKERLIKYMVEVNIYYQEYRKRTEIDVIKEQK